MSHPMTADAMYGRLSVLPAVNVAPSNAVAGGAAVPSPDPGPARSSARSPAVGDLMDDPTFWLVVLVGTGIALAAASY